MQMYATPPLPPALPATLANQSISQLLTLFSSPNSQQSGFMNSLLATTARLTAINTQNKSSSSLVNSSNFTSSILASTPSTASTPNSAASLVNVLNNSNISLQQKARLAFSNHTNPDGSAVKITPKNQYQMSAVSQSLNKNFASNFTGSRAIQLPKLTFNDATTTQAYNNFVTALEDEPKFISMFKKIHITALHQLYQYLVGISATLNLMNINDLKTYIILESQLGINKKTLILGHLVDLLQSQLTQTIQGIMPGMPDQVAIRAGMSALHNQGSNNLNMFTLDMEQSVVTILGMDLLTQDQVALIVKTLTIPSNATLIQSNPDIHQSDYQAALKIMSPSNADFVQKLTTPQSDALFEALMTISAGVTHAQTVQSLKNILNQLENPTTAQPLSSADYQYFKTMINQIAYGIPLQDIVTITQSLAKKITTKSSVPFTSAEFDQLKSSLAYITSIFEEKLSEYSTQIVMMLGALNQENMVLSVSQQIALQSIAQEMLDTKNPLTLSTLNETDRGLFARALTIFGQNPPDTLVTYASQYKTLGGQLTTNIVDQKTLSSDQTKALEAVLQYLGSFVFSPTTLTEAENSFSTSDQTIIQQAFDAINSPTFTSFATFDKPTQKLILQTVQKFDTILQTRLQIDTFDASSLNGIFGETGTLNSAVSAGMTMDDYDSLSTIYEYIRTTQGLTGTLSGSSLASIYASQKPSPYDTLVKMFSVSSVSGQSSYLDFLLGVSQQNNTSTVIQQVVKNLSASDLQAYKDIASKFQSVSFKLSSLNTSEIQLLTNFFQPLETAMIQTLASTKNNDSLGQLLQNTAMLVSQTNAFNTMKASFLWVLQKYLLFFNAYTSSLQQSTKTNYQVISAFINQAKTISQTLQANVVQTVNPPLFFYDATSMRSLQMLVQVAQLVEGTSMVPYPTFCVEQALNGSTINPYDGITYTNSVSMGQGSFVYKKFFFMDSTQKSGSSLQTTALPELTGLDAKKISWLKKVPVPISQETITTSNGTTITNYDHMYIAQNKPNDISGFYMNIPVFDSDPTNSGTVLIRLFEQEIIAQPEWLNHSGLNKDSSGKIIPGVVTVLRGCMGDFMSLLDLNIFDPCLTVIFKTALGMTTSGPQNIGANDPNFTKETQDCGLYLQEKSLEDQRMQQATTVKSTTITQSSNAGGSISTGAVS